MDIKYTDDVRMKLKMAGMTDAQINMAELKANLDFKRIRELPEPTKEELGTLPEKYASSGFDLMGVIQPG